MPTSAARLRPLDPPRRQARALVRAIDALAAIYGAVLAFAVVFTADSLLEGRLPDGNGIDAHIARTARLGDLDRSGLTDDAPHAFEVATGMPAPLLGRARWQEDSVELDVRLGELPLYAFLWALRFLIGVALLYVGYRTVRTVSAGLGGPWTFTESGARWMRRLGVAGMASFVALFLIDGMLNRLGRNHIEALARSVKDLRADPLVLDVSVLWAFPLFFFLWLLGGAMHRAATFEREIRDTV